MTRCGLWPAKVAYVYIDLFSYPFKMSTFKVSFIMYLRYQHSTPNKHTYICTSEVTALFFIDSSAQKKMVFKF